MTNTKLTKTNLKNFSTENEHKFYIVATPIGNMGDITHRAIEILKSVDVVLCEDTRVSGVFLKNLGIKTKLDIYNDQSDVNTRKKILNKILTGNSVALISDAGTPLISDPGYKLVAYLQENNVKVEPIPGASAVIAALCSSGLPTDTFYFGGFLPNTSGKIKSILEDLRSLKSTLVFYESPNRLLKSLGEIKNTFQKIEVCIARELTKLHEEIFKADVSDVITHFENRKAIKGEIVVMINNRIAEEVSDDAILSQIRALKKTMSLKDAVDTVAKNAGVSRKFVYALALKDL